MVGVRHIGGGLSDPAQPPDEAARIEAERAGLPFLLYRDGEGAQRIYTLDESASPLSIGRGWGSHVRLEWDENVSRLHAELVRIGEEWTLEDDGLSRNGSYLNGERIAGRRRLQDGDVLRFGETDVTFRTPAYGDRGTTAIIRPSEQP